MTQLEQIEKTKAMIDAIEANRSKSQTALLNTLPLDTMPNDAILFTRLVYDRAYMDGVQFISTYIAKIVVDSKLESKLESITNKIDPHTKSKSFGVVSPIPKENLN
jgi:hypothetical protein